MIPAHWSSLMADVPESVRRSMRILSAGMWKTLNPARSRSASRSFRVVEGMGSTTLIRNGSMGVLISGMFLLSASVGQNETSFLNSR